MSPSAPSSGFGAECVEIVEGLERDVAALLSHRGREPDLALVNSLFRGFHSLKGLAALFAQSEVERLAHFAEDVLDRLRLGKVSLTAEVLDALADVPEGLQAVMAQAPGGASALIDRLEALGEATPVLAKESPEASLDRIGLEEEVRAVLTEYEEHRLREQLRRGASIWSLAVSLTLADFDQGLDELNTRLKPLGEVIATLPAPQGSAEGPAPHIISFRLIFGGEAPAGELAAVLEPFGGVARLIPVEPPKRAARYRPSLPERLAKHAPHVTHSLARGPGQSVRVEIRRLDGLMDSVSELLRLKSSLQQLMHQAGASMPRELGQRCDGQLQKLEHRLEALREDLLETRLVPLGQLFDKLSRLVRRAARDAGKEIELKASGAEVKLDKVIVEELSDSLMHLLRNALDHGIEPPEARRRLGKRERGLVSIGAAQRGSQVVIEVSDDGGGLDVPRIREGAVRRGLVSKEAAPHLADRDLHAFLFTPGFSTASGVSALSGRGVGLDVVKTNVGNLSGLIEVSSGAGKGTTFTLTLPVTLSVLRALIIGAAGSLYALPVNNVVEVLAVNPTEILAMEEREVVSVRGQAIPFARLSRLLGHGPDERVPQWMVVVGLAQGRLGLAADEVLGEQDVVVKPPAGRKGSAPGIGGRADLGDQRTALVLDVGALAEMRAQNPRGSC